jgi:hypothetical protein
MQSFPTSLSQAFATIEAGQGGPRHNTTSNNLHSAVTRRFPRVVFQAHADPAMLMKTPTEISRITASTNAGPIQSRDQWTQRFARRETTAGRIWLPCLLYMRNVPTSHRRAVT